MPVDAERPAALSQGVPFRALIVDDEETYARSLMRLLARRGVTAEHAASCAEGLRRARRTSYDLVILDYLLPDGDGLGLIGPMRALTPPPRVLMMTAFGTIESAVEAMRLGADDYLTKSTAIDALVERVLEARRVAETAPMATTAGTTANTAPPRSATAPEAMLVGDSPAMREVRQRIAEVARSPETTVLLMGESGTGKGVAARLIHSLGPRAGEPFVAIDCVALPPTLAESELFGHEKGAFTGAERAKPGRLELGGCGTVLLDEIGDMEPALQGKLLRVLEERSFERVGGIKPLPFRARVIAASHRDLAQLVEERRFRLDLYHRLSVFPITLPPLRERGDDVLLLAERFLTEFGARLGKRFAPLDAEVCAVLRAYPFPGNVRELRNLVERASILAPSDALTVELLPARVREPHAAARPSSPPALTSDAPPLELGAGDRTLDSVEKQLLVEALRRAQGRKTRAAALLGISRFALARRMEKHGLGKPDL